MSGPLRTILRVALSLVPLALTPLLGRLLAQGDINLGGGEKDILVLLPWLLWSLMFAISSWVFWYRGFSVVGSLWRSAVVGLFGLAVVAAILAVLGRLGMAGLL